MMPAAIRSTALICLVAAAALAGCQVMDSSVSYQTRPDGSQARRCDSGLGSYALPYTTMKVTVVQDYKGTARVGRPRLSVSADEHHPDPKHLYCLDFLENAFSDDAVTVAFAGQGDVDADPEATSSATGMLSVIASKNIDQSGEVIRNLIRAIFIFASGDFNFGRQTRDTNLKEVTMTEQSVNPFDLKAMSSLNKSLREFGFCLTLGKYTYDTNRFGANAYCNNPNIPLAVGREPPFLRAAKEQSYLVGKTPVGIFYRPRQPYELFVHVRDDPDIGGPWKLRKIDRVMLENISPILVLKVNRAIFAEHRTALAFDHGNLLDVCIAKGSQVQGGLQIPLEIVYGLVSLPGATIVKEIENQESTQGLVAKQTELITLQNNILAQKAGANKNAEGSPLGAKLNFEPKVASGNPPEAIGRVKQNSKLAEFCKLLKQP